MWVMRSVWQRHAGLVTYAHGMIAAASPRSLEVAGSRTRTVAVSLLVGLLLVVAAAWYVTHPAPLPTQTETVPASAPVGGTVYVGLYFSPADAAGRSLSIDEVAVPANVDLGDGVAALICRDGAFSVTADPDAFCRSLDPAENETLEPGDTLALGISSVTALEAELGPATVSYREGLQWGTHEVGPPIGVTFRDR